MKNVTTTFRSKMGKLWLIMKKLMYDGLHCIYRIITNLKTKPP